MADLEARVQQMLNAPAGCAFLLIMAENSFTPEQAASPDLAVYIGARAMDMVQVWNPEHEEVVAEIMRRGQAHLELARELLAHPNAAWWFASVDVRSQVWVSRGSEPPAVERFREPHSQGRPECYGQKPTDAGLFTSSLIDGVAPVWAAMDLRVCDYDVPFPLACWRMRAAGDARVYEVDGPEAWHALCVRYPWRCNPEQPLNIEGLLVPDWRALAQEWDAVHMTFGGLLTAEQVFVASPAGTTWHWGWGAEQTVWLRWMFDDAERLLDREKGDAPANVKVPWLRPLPGSRQRQPYVDMRAPRLQAEQGAMLMRVDDPAAAEAERQRFLRELLERRRRESQNE